MHRAQGECSPFPGLQRTASPKSGVGENKYNSVPRTAQMTADELLTNGCVGVWRSTHPGVPSAAKTAVIAKSAGPSEPCSTLLHVKTVKAGSLGRTW